MAYLAPSATLEQGRGLPSMTHDGREAPRRPDDTSNRALPPPHTFIRHIYKVTNNK